MIDYQDNLLTFGHSTKNAVSAETLAAEFGTPLYVYDEPTIANGLKEWHSVLPHYPNTSLCYAVKANGALALLRYFANAGLNFDIVSGGEMARLFKVGVTGDRIIFSGVGKSITEIEMGLEGNIRCFNVESQDELYRLSKIGKAHGVKVPVALRLNPDIDAKTHPYISTGLKENKFGLALHHINTALQWFDELSKDGVLQWEGLDCHIGSNLQDPSPYHEASQMLLDTALMLRAKGIPIHHVDLGGGLGVRYRPEDNPPSVADFLLPVFKQFKDSGFELIFEPGRRLIGEAGALLTRVEYIKKTESHRFLVVDAAMNDLIRPALYEGWHNIIPCDKNLSQALPPTLSDVVGPICESADFLGKDRMLAGQEGELFAIMTAGAYAAAMGSNYNARPRAAEVWVDEKGATLIRRRETLEDLWDCEIF